ncbi:hypothetical protein T492DRAFT_1041864 [Pavlovales sp. CCMP2436]|nr:hypothetical protein T492DRAFT_1041864 [Pavlovales sp. CCMP2436]
MVQQVCVVQSLAWSTSGSGRAIDPNPHAPASVCAPAPTPRLGRASAAAALPWRPQGAASSS